MKSQKYKPKIEIWRRKISGQDFFYDYSARLTNPLQGTIENVGAGASINKNTAKLRAICEVIERATGSRISSKLVYCSEKELQKTHLVLDPKKVIVIKGTRNGYQEYSSLSTISWLKGIILDTNKEIMVPAFSVYLGYNQQVSENEKFSPTVSSGLASGADFQSAVKKGLEELLEQDSALLCWYKRQPIPLINLKTVKNISLKYFYHQLKIQNLNPFVGITSFDVKYPTTIGMIVGSKKEYPYVTFGLGSGDSIEFAALKSLEEALVVRNTLMLQLGKLPIKPISKKRVKSFLEHALFYALPKRIKDWEFLLYGTQYSVEKINSMFNFLSPPSYNLEKLKQIFRQEGFEIIVVDLTDKIARIFGLKVVKVLVPEFQRLDFDFNLKPRLGKRAVEILQQRPSSIGLPHPFA